ncbi:MAG: MmgE/PrpD family protein [Chloroflexi bacterium]|nr:MmgE/PrpD family protein [Chloroflexota bacterium]
MDRVVNSITSFAVPLDFTALPSEAVHQIKRHLLDSLGCAVWGYRSEPARIAMKMSEGVQFSRPATVIGSGQKTTPELAAFANDVMLRYPEFNDIYMSRTGGCHPSDNFPAILACGESAHASGREIITAAVLAYEILCRLFDSVGIRMRERFHLSTQGVISSAVGAAKVLRLQRDQFAQAISLAVASYVGIRQITRGQLSMWKGCGFANACRNGVFAARLAAEGMTGPEAIFEGKSGFFNVVSGPFDLGLEGVGHPYKIMQTSLKRFPTGAHSQTAIDAALSIRSRLGSAEDIDQVTIKTYNFGVDTMAGDRQKWHPETRETADHSLPYIVATALRYGTVGFEHFSNEYLKDRQLSDLVQKIRVVPSEECNRAFPETLTNIIEVTTRDGRTFSEKVPYYRGHVKNPMSDEEIEKKFVSLTEGLLNPGQSKSLIDMAWNLEKIEDIGSLMELMGV